MLSISAMVPSFNNCQTVYCTAWSLKNQSCKPSSILQIDDGSTDDSWRITEDLGLSVIRNTTNRGRGYVRAKAIELCEDEFLACCDASNYLQINFIENAIGWFDDPKVAAVFGQIYQAQPKSLADRWRARHLYKLNQNKNVDKNAILSTYGCILRRSAVVQVGNFDRSLRHSEDSDLGIRLLRAGYKVVYDPSLHVISCIKNDIVEVLDRYWRWYAGADEKISIRKYGRLVWYSVRVLALRDIKDKDFFSIPISLSCPHYQFWKSWIRRLLNRVQE
jgi:cellulose synthase/poly-beta-1,6-N-acetylglucosamine synthase-like glycosyltransferase